MLATTMTNTESAPAPSEESEILEFKWGKMRGKGGKKKDTQFYQSFTLDGVDYELFDTVYVQNGFAELSIGKIIKIWETPTVEKFRKIKVQWFFRPRQISKFLNGVKIYYNELFFACGDGTELASVSSLVIQFLNFNFLFVFFFYLSEEIMGLGGFAKGVGRCSAFVAELWGVVEGLLLAQRMGFENAELSIDSKAVLHVITTGKINGTDGYAIIRKIRRLLLTDWNVKVMHEYREANKCADALANIGCNLDHELIFYDASPVEESIAGKCNVVCISKDARNPQPSDETVRRAEFVFYRCFDVGERKIVEEIDDKIVGIEVKNIFNKTA